MQKNGWLRGNKLRIYRFEDIALDPIKMSKEIFNFTGLVSDDKILKWISDNTNQNSGGVYSIHKNSTQIGWSTY